MDFAKAVRMADMLGAALAEIMLVYVIGCIVVLYIETSESRLRRLAVLPIPIVSIGRARLLVPLALYAIYMILVLLTKLPLLIAWKSLGESPIASFACDLLLVNARLACEWLLVTYGIRLLSELYGRMLLLVALFLYLASALFLLEPIRNHILDLISGYGFSAPWSLLTVIFFMFLIHLSFLRRRSYLL
jgi:hypothetical protein